MTSAGVQIRPFRRGSKSKRAVKQKCISGGWLFKNPRGRWAVAEGTRKKTSHINVTVPSLGKNISKKKGKRTLKQGKKSAMAARGIGASKKREKRIRTGVGVLLRERTHT